MAEVKVEAITEGSVPNGRQRQGHSLRHQWKMIRGKLQRFYVGHFKKEHVARRLALRRGACQRCGACCRLLFRCAFAAECGGNTGCRIYKQRPVNCRIFPLNQRHLDERDLVMPERRCGYYFEGEEPRPLRHSGNGHGKKAEIKNKKDSPWRSRLVKIIPPGRKKPGEATKR